jgi:hypothetical protein
LPGVPTNLPKRRQDKPIEAVELRISFKTDRRSAAKVKELVSSARLRQGNCEVVIEGESPGDVAERARAVLEKVRAVMESPESI